MIEFIEIRSLFKEIEKVSNTTRLNAEELGFNTTETYEIELSVVEAVTNCIKHAYNGESENPVEVEFSIENDIFKIIITDYGKKWETFEEEKNKPDPFRFSSENPGDVPQNGMGFALLVDIMDEIDYQRKENFNILVLTKRLPE